MLLKEKWLSLLFHISNFHEFPENTIFKRCEHGDIDRQWLEPTSAPYIALKKIVTEKLFLSDMQYFMDFLHTGNLEVFHSLLLKYVPKRLHFSFYGMIARTQMAVHFNEAMKCQQALTKDRVPRCKLQYSKLSKTYVAKPIKTAPEKVYIEDLRSQVVQITTEPDTSKPKLPNLPDIVDKPEKEEVINKSYTRFRS